MGVVGSLPSPPPVPELNETTKISCKESIPSSDECIHCGMMVDEMDSNINCSSNSNIDNNNKTNCCVKRKSPSPVTYGPLNKKVRRSAALTLATGRRSKFMKLEGEAALHREMRRKRNREAAKKLKEKRLILEERLNKDIRELESKEEDLLLRIKNLKTHKEYLEAQHRHTISVQEKLPRTASSKLKQIEYNQRRVHPNIVVYENVSHTKEEPRPLSPQWQLLFRI